MAGMWIVQGEWQERHGCDCRFCDREFAYTEIELTLAAENRDEALTKALTHFGKDSSFGGKWRRSPMAHLMSEAEKMAAAGVKEFPWDLPPGGPWNARMKVDLSAEIGKDDEECSD